MCEKTLDISVKWSCPICGKTMRNGLTHIRAYPKPSIFTKRCDDCDFSMVWFETKKGISYTLDSTVDDGEE